MALVGKPESISMSTSNTLVDLDTEAQGRCLSVLMACSLAMDELLVQARRKDEGASVDTIHQLILSPNTLCEGDGRVLRQATERLAAKLGCQMVLVDMNADRKGMN